jgi:hypothetical protein
MLSPQGSEVIMWVVRDLLRREDEIGKSEANAVSGCNVLTLGMSSTTDAATTENDQNKEIC